MTCQSGADEIKHFVVAFLRNHGAELVESAHSIRVRLPMSLARDLQVSSRLELCFHASFSTDTVEYITFGHPLLDRMLVLADRRGAITSLLFTRGLDPDFVRLALCGELFGSVTTDHKELARLRRVLRRLGFPNARWQVVQRRFLHQLQLLFVFRVSFISDEKQEQIVPILIDPETECSDTLVDLDEAVSFLPRMARRSRGMMIVDTVAGEPAILGSFMQHAGKMLPKESYAVLRLFRRACQVLEGGLRRQWEEFCGEAERRLQADLERIEEYYRGLAQETLDPLRRVFRRMAALSVRAQLAHSWETHDRYAGRLHQMKQETIVMESSYEEQVDQLQEDKARRQSELMAKYRTRAEVCLTSIAEVRVPRLELTMRLQGPMRRDVTFSYDVLRQRLGDLCCDRCAQPMHEVYVCHCGELVCVECFSPCADCHKALCQACASAQCHICGASLCSGCGTRCSWDPSTLCVCADCRAEMCPVCLQLLGKSEERVGEDFPCDEQMSGQSGMEAAVDALFSQG